MRGTTPGVLVVVVVALIGLLSGCAVEIPGYARAVGEVDPGTVAGLPVSQGPSGPVPGVPDAQLRVDNADGGDMDRLAVDAVADVQEYWAQALPAGFNGARFKPITRLVSFDSAGRPVEVCHTSTAGLVNAFYCGLDDSVSWDRGELLPQLNQALGPMAVVVVFAHEIGHAVQFRLGPASHIDQATPSIVKEQQADCYAGNFMRWVAEGHAQHFRLSTGAGLNKVLAALFSVRDPSGATFSMQNAHGSAFDRVFAFQTGFAANPQRCAAIDLNEIQRRATETAFTPQDTNGGNLPINEQTLALLQRSLQFAFRQSGAVPPTFRTGGATCPDARSTDPASYCPATNTIILDVARLARIGTPPSRRGQGGGGGIGDFAAFGEVASRYALSVEKAVGLRLDDPNAGLRTACLTGAWAGIAGQVEDPQNPLRLSPGDLDEAIAELLADGGLIASDVNGQQVPAGFARVEAFRIGYLQGSGACTAKFG
ncbi:neutral zinc metallopeptidase [Gandjariella thermophila]|uniref:Aminopeptidase n=1 Tax=Gandjariella thermophila TaxID=1931992 RepID=A0A4D4JEP9_9PSEU|nr:neutral zinc metallopeptidase [Gandjariella thermophila]GDY32387.1 aminopeptidase [Gandjariella thermophila]